MARKPKPQKLRDAALARVTAGESVRDVAASLKVSPTAVRGWMRQGKPVAATTPNVEPSNNSIGTVDDEDPSDLFTKQAEPDAELHAQADSAANTQEETTATTEPAGPRPVDPEVVVDLFEGVVGMVLRVVVVGKGATWTPELERACQFSPGERNRLRATAPYVAEHVGSALNNSPWVGVALFGFSALEVVAARFALVKATVPVRQLTPRVADAPDVAPLAGPSVAPLNRDPDSFGEPMQPTPTPELAAGPAKANFGI